MVQCELFLYTKYIYLFQYFNHTINLTNVNFNSMKNAITGAILVIVSIILMHFW